MVCHPPALITDLIIPGILFTQACCIQSTGWVGTVVTLTAGAIFKHTDTDCTYIRSPCFDDADAGTEAAS